MNDKYKLIKRDGSFEWRPFIIKNGKEYISEHISRKEFGQHDNGEVIIFAPLIDLFEALREKVGKPIIINSGYRSREYQQKLYEADGGSGKVAKPGSSPHQYGAAMDLAIPSRYTAAFLAELARTTSRSLGLLDCRCGYKAYGGRFLHIDIVYLLFCPHTDRKNPFPAVWRPGVTW